MSEEIEIPHEHNFLEEKTPEGTLLLGPCLDCGWPAGEALLQANEELKSMRKDLFELYEAALPFLKKLDHRIQQGIPFFTCTFCGFNLPKNEPEKHRANCAYLRLKQALNQKGMK